MNSRVVLVVIVFMSSSIFCGTGMANPVPYSFHAMIHIEKDGVPITENVGYTLKCYGYPERPLPQTEYLRPKTADDPNPPQLVYSAQSSGTRYITDQCDTCDYGYLGLEYPGSSELCLLTGFTPNMTFNVWNASERPAVTHTVRQEWPHDFYDFYFTLPSDEKEQAGWTTKLSVSSLWCTFLNLFGAKC